MGSEFWQESGHLRERWFSAKASAHGVVGATEGSLPPAFALPTSFVWIIRIVLGVQSCPEDLVLEDRMRRTGPR